MPATSRFYEQHADCLAEQYTSLKFEDVHASWRAFWPQARDRVLDVGAGSGRDAKWMAEHGCEVIAIEPAQALLRFGKSYCGDSVTWLEDGLPKLEKTINLGFRFDLILVSAVWMHLAPTHRERAFRKLANLLAPNGRLVISLRHGDFSDGRKAYPVSVEELEKFAKNSALMVRNVSLDDDQLQRTGVSWQTIVMSLPDDGSGDLNKVRHIIVNDSKSATYKLALLRTLLRIADAHSGAVVDRSDGKVVIPLGLVGLYWIRQFKRLIDKENIQQNSNSSKGLGFIKPEGWGRLSHLSPDDLAIGATFFGEDAVALDKAIKDSLKTIKDGPVTFTYQGDKSNPYFEMIRSAKKPNKGSIVVDSEFLESYGLFVLDESLWDCFRLYNSWIEPLVVNQWIMEMQRFRSNQERGIPLQTYHDCLVWIDKDYDTRVVRKRIEQLKLSHSDIVSVWSGSKLRNEYHVDHCLPFAYWPNNDKWNLLPTSKAENLNKRDRIPASYRLNASKPRILDWWQLAWGETDTLSRTFFTEASLSLPNVPASCQDFEHVFEAMGLQIRGVKSRLCLAEW
ncbi:TPA: methyltransferase domain-containing protein [Vibrio parahaemolyticus]|uniref:Class I SAM-dependent methyltransferase n=6 Tax=Vibrio parahaemolyticus TaxID=670 RepID=A0AA47JHU6_VIBPH|nr:class I SAM-dependent methyltransferase [Vibrio parahaemolyticus]MCX8776612.1 methyltransferase domain-containing protein [Vibrio parahaemolyticus]MEA5350301.1 class I SAM-dependent methyltransferase [Vibrio parahaemolyticus]TOP16198.1 SAM-dependent methyltransferase [Vibrio parahaemolyticus]WAT91052.1 class I SAM-dependent methyltransferase [Vibrio parahaemolyticus]HCE2184097.1 methyltransferase domain-containing protein [Vibrio parahaemolyticus]